MKATKVAATLVIKRPSKMSISGRKSVAQWLRRQAIFLEQHADRTALRFTARYVY